jgi:hypothetical protein
MQDVIAILIAAVASAFLVRRAWHRVVRPSSGACGSCGNCPTSDSMNGQRLVSISPVIVHAKPASDKVSPSHS